MTTNTDLFDSLRPALLELDAAFAHLPSDPNREVLSASAKEILQATAARLGDNDPYHHPLYAGQMLKPPHPIARLAYVLAMGLNPNNHALDGGRASSRMEKEVVQDTARLFGFERHLGHLTGGGTLANFEALWVARELAPGRAIAASSLAHYTHARLSAVLQVPFVSIPTDARGRMDLLALERALQEGSIGTVVASLGTTAFGTTDPLDEILKLRDRYPFRLHVDAAYGGYFRLARGLAKETADAFASTLHVDSLVVDPHKHGLQPYGCGCILFADPEVGRFYRHDSPYTYFSSDELHLGEISLECSRAGAAAVALWATVQHFPYEVGGAFAARLEASLRAAQHFYSALEMRETFTPLIRPELDILVFAARGETATESSERARRIYQEAKALDLHLALAEVRPELAATRLPALQWDRKTLTCLRSVLMKPEHEAWLPEILSRLDRAAGVAC